jgi:nucleoid-associated protein YgaU
MRKLLVSVFVATGLILTGVSSFALEDHPQGAETEQQQREQPTTNQEATKPTEIKGEVTNVKEDTVEVKDESGMTHSFNTTALENADELKASPLEPGDMVKVEIENGVATSIERIEGEDQASSEDLSKDEGDISAEGAATEEERMAADSAEPVMKEDAGSAEVTSETESQEPLSEDEQGAEVAGEGEYIVKEGDTLAEIAEEHLGSQDKWIIIARANDLENPDSIHVGQRLTIPSESEIQSEEFDQKQGLEQAPEEMRKDEPTKDDSGSPLGDY